MSDHNVDTAGTQYLTTTVSLIQSKTIHMATYGTTNQESK
jgi:hypothetical protein